MKKGFVISSIVLSISGIALIIFFALNPSFNDGSRVVNPELASQFGSFISGIVGPLFTLVGFLLLYLNIYEQKKQFKIQQFESKLFELIKYHRENVAEISYIPASCKNETEKLYGRNVFIQLKKELLDLFSTVKTYLNDNDVGQNEKDIIGITYTIFFFGVSERTLKTTEDQLKHYQLEASLVSQLLEFLREKKKTYNNKIVYFGGHQSKLGFYFRHIYRTIKFIEGCNDISQKEKLNYSKMLRSQLTNYEQAIFFFNSLSEMGKEWRNDYGQGKLIEKYEMIKNIPPYLLGDINVESYYPNIEYEYNIQ